MDKRLDIVSKSGLMPSAEHRFHYVKIFAQPLIVIQQSAPVAASKILIIWLNQAEADACVANEIDLCVIQNRCGNEGCPASIFILHEVSVVAGAANNVHCVGSDKNHKNAGVPHKKECG